MIKSELLRSPAEGSEPQVCYFLPKKYLQMGERERLASVRGVLEIY